MEVNKIYQGDCLDVMANMEDCFINLTVTSLRYDNLREYEGFCFDYKKTISELYRVTKQGGVVVWVVGDATIKGSETGTSFRQALYFKEIGFNLHDTMIWNKGGFSSVGALAVRYAPVFEYMFIFSRGKPRVFNPLKDRKTKHGGKEVGGTIRNVDGSMKPMSKRMVINNFGQRYNIWDIGPQRQSGEGRHPAPFPEQLARDHILSWSKVGDLVFDPFMGSGTTAKMAIVNKRNFVGSEISEEYVEICNKRIAEALRKEGEILPFNRGLIN